MSTSRARNKALKKALKDESNDKLKVILKTPLDIVKLFSRTKSVTNIENILNRIFVNDEAWFDELFENYSVLKTFLTQVRPFIEPSYHPIDSMYQQLKLTSAELIIKSTTRFTRMIEGYNDFNDFCNFNHYFENFDKDTMIDFIIKNNIFSKYATNSIQLLDLCCRSGRSAKKILEMVLNDKDMLAHFSKADSDKLLLAALCKDLNLLKVDISPLVDKLFVPEKNSPQNSPSASPQVVFFRKEKDKGKGKQKESSAEIDLDLAATARERAGI